MDRVRRFEVRKAKIKVSRVSFHGRLVTDVRDASHGRVVCIKLSLFKMSSLIALRVSERSLSLKGTRTFSLPHSHMNISSFTFAKLEMPSCTI